MKNRHVPLSQQAYEQIKRSIVSLELEPGQVIDESSLRVDLNLGRTPIREALQRLALEKLVTIVPRRGTFVTEIGITDLQQLFEVRLMLEAQAARLAAQRGSRQHWQQMDAALSGLSDSTDDGTSLADNEALIAIDEACHKLMYAAADNEFLEDVLTTLYALSLRLWYFSLSKIGDMREAIREHRYMLDAFKVRDGELAAQLMEQHIQAFQEEIQSIMLGVPAA